MTERTCKVDECNKKANGCGLCHMHYWRLRYRGDINHERVFIRKRCSIEDCQKWSRKRGWCSMHYSRYLAHGDPLKVLQRPEKHGLVNTPEYESWRGMKERCLSPRHVAYTNYGGKGIAVCDEWRYSFLTFLNDMGHKPSKRHSLDRINPNGNYEPSNCRWANHTTQAINTGKRKDNTSGYRGVAKGNRAWIAYINYKHKRYSLGTFDTAIEAAKAYNLAATKYHKKNAVLNIIELETL